MPLSEATLVKRQVCTGCGAVYHYKAFLARRFQLKETTLGTPIGAVGGAVGGAVLGAIAGSDSRQTIYKPSTEAQISFENSKLREELLRFPHPVPCPACGHYPTASIDGLRARRLRGLIVVAAGFAAIGII
jgi:hypothetical protein